MAYKYTRGSVNRGDIYNEDDTQGNTYLDWSEDALGIVTGGSTTLVVSASAVGIGTPNPDTTLHIEGSNDGSMWEALRITNTGGTLNDDSAIYFTHYTDDRLQAFIKDDVRQRLGYQTTLRYSRQQQYRRHQDDP